MKLKTVYEGKNRREIESLSEKAGICPFAELCPDDLLEKYDSPEDICSKCISRHFSDVVSGTVKLTDISACYSYTDAEMSYTSLIAALINACLCHIHDNGCEEISCEDYDRIKNAAQFLVESDQVLMAEDITIGAILECFNDTDINRKYL